MNGRLVAMTALVAVLGGYLVFQNLGALSPGRSGDAVLRETALPRATAAKLNPLQDLDSESFDAVLQRPLFNPSRLPRPAEPLVTPEPPVVEQPPPPPPPPPPPQGPGPDDYKLLGVASGPEGRVAALRVASNGEVVYLRKGESVDNWSVVEVGERTVAIGSPENPVTYSMFSADDAAADENGQPAAIQPGQAQPLPLPLPMPQPAKPPGLPEQHSVPDTGG